MTFAINLPLSSLPRTIGILFSALLLLFGAQAVLAQGTETASKPNVMQAPTPDNIWVLDLSNGGRVRIALYPQYAPTHVERIKLLSREGFYNGLKFHRVIPGFMAQGGDPKGDGTGGSPLPDLKAEFNTLPHVRGVVSMARSGSPDSANSQFFIMFMPNLGLDFKYTGFGRVISGMEFVDSMAVGEPPANPTYIVQASIESDNKPRPEPMFPPLPDSPQPAGAPFQ